MERPFAGTRALTAGLFLTAVLTCLPGCSLFVMAGKMLFGDPKIKNALDLSSGVNLAKSGKKVLVLCSVPHSIQFDSPSLDVDILNGVTRRLKTRGIKVVSPDDVATWLDDNGEWDDPAEVADELGAYYVIQIDLTRLSYNEDGAPNLFRGQAVGDLHGYEIREIDGTPRALEIYTQEFTSVYPRSHPVSADQKSAALFRKEYLDRLCHQLALRFYDHRFSEEVE